MAESHNFRSALHGFKREDVVRYIEYLNSKHNNLVNQLMSENQALQDELAAYRTAEPEVPDTEEPPEEISAQPEAEEAAQEPVCQTPAQPAIPAVNLAEEELAAYRRAERAEREAKERARQMYQQATATLAEATAQVDFAAAQLELIASRVKGQLTDLQNAVSDSKRCLHDAAATIAAIRPEEDN